MRTHAEAEKSSQNQVCWLGRQLKDMSFHKQFVDTNRKNTYKMEWARTRAEPVLRTTKQQMLSREYDDLDNGMKSDDKGKCPREAPLPQNLR